MDKKTPFFTSSIGLNLGSIAQQVRESRALCAIAALALATFCLSTHSRNRAWSSPGELWYDIALKVSEHRQFDPTTGLEIPRADRGRIYNNLGLHLYDLAKQINKAENHLPALQKIADERSGTAQTKARQQIQDIQSGIDALRHEIIKKTPPHLHEACRALGMDFASNDWDPFIPAETAFRTALYHIPTYSIARLNTGLVYKLRSGRTDLPVQTRRRYQEKAEEEFRLAHTLAPGYEKALRYHASILLEMEEYAKAREMALRALAQNDQPDSGHDRLEEVRLVAAASLYLKDWLTARRMLAAYAASEPDRQALADSFFFLAGILESQKDFAHMEEALRLGLSYADDRGAWLHYRLVQCLMAQDRLPEAQASIRELIRNTPEPPRLFIELEQKIRARISARSSSPK